MATDISSRIARSAGTGESVYRATERALAELPQYVRACNAWQDPAALRARLAELEGPPADDKELIREACKALKRCERLLSNKPILTCEERDAFLDVESAAAKLTAALEGRS